MEFRDQMNRKIELNKTPQRIISLVPSQTELLIDLGLKNRVKGITKFCVHPKNLRNEKQIVGGTKGIRMDRIHELNPDLILCNKEENTREMIEELEKDFNLHISDIHTLEDTFELIEQYGEIFEVQQRAQEINRNIQNEYEKFRSFIKEQPVLKVAYFIWRKPWMVAGGDNFVNYMLKINGFGNVYESISRYPEIDIENLKETDYVFLSSEPYPFQEKHIPEVQAYAANAKFALVDGEFFSWYGSRLEKAFTYFKELREKLN